MTSFAEEGTCEGGTYPGPSCNKTSECSKECVGGLSPGKECTTPANCPGKCSLDGKECGINTSCERNVCVIEQGKTEGTCSVTQATCSFSLPCVKNQCNSGQCKQITRCMKDGKELLITLSSDALEAKVLGNQVDLTLTTTTEKKVAKIFIYRGKKEAEETLQVKQVCDLDSKGSEVSGRVYECIDKNLPAETYQYWPASIDYNADCTTHYLGQKIEVTIQK